MVGSGPSASPPGCGETRHSHQAEDGRKWGGYFGADGAGKRPFAAASYAEPLGPTTMLDRAD